MQNDHLRQAYIIGAKQVQRTCLFRMRRLYVAEQRYLIGRLNSVLAKLPNSPVRGGEFWSKGCLRYLGDAWIMP